MGKHKSKKLRVGDFVRLKAWGDGTPYRVKEVNEDGIVIEWGEGEYPYFFVHTKREEWKLYYHIDDDDDLVPSMRKEEPELEYRMIRI